MFGDPRLPQDFWDQVSPEPNSGCWLWTGRIWAEQGQYKSGPSYAIAHRLLFSTLIGFGPDDSNKIRHSCGDKACVNPEHMRVPKRMTKERRRAYLNEWQRNELATNPEYRARRNAQSRENYYRDPKRHNAATMRWMAENGERRRNNERIWYAANPEKTKAAAHRARLKRYGLTNEEFERMFADQAGGCAICGEPLVLNTASNKRRSVLHVDHCHKTGLVRGLLCGNCNLGIGMFADDPDKLRAAILYLEKARQL